MERTHFLIYVLVFVVSLYADEVECRRGGTRRTGGSFGGSSGGGIGEYWYIPVAVGAGIVIAILVIICSCIIRIRRADRQSLSKTTRGTTLATTTDQPRTSHGIHNDPKPYIATENPGFRGSQLFSTHASKSKQGNDVNGTPPTFQQY